MYKKKILRVWYTNTISFLTSKLNQIWTIITLFQLIRHQTELRLLPNRSKKCNYKFGSMWQCRQKDSSLKILQKQKCFFLCRKSEFFCLSEIGLTESTKLPPSTHREIFSESYWIKPKSDCIYHFPIDLEQNRRIRLCSKYA